MKETLTGQKMNEILYKTIEAIENSKKEIFQISENTRNECEKSNYKLSEINSKTKVLIKEVDKLELEEMKSRKKLADVSKNFKDYSEEDIKRAYEKANNLRVELIIKRKEEKDIILQRNDLERRLKVNHENLERAEKLISQVRIALEYLNGDFDEIIETFDELNKKQLLGIKVIKAQENERQRVARDIHDGPAQSLANVVLKTQISEKMISIDKNKALKELKELKSLVRESLKDIRKIIYDLRPMSLDDLGLVPTIRRYGEEFHKETGIEVNVDVLELESKMNSYVQLSVFRIVQESLNNIKKHAEATQASILIQVNEARLKLIIKDDGKGFEMDTLKKYNDDIDCGFGLMGMEERAKLLGGIFGIKSSIGKGTKIVLILPNNRKDDLNE
nr:sensor histidine kinase [Anaeromonas gelatinilytica]